MQQRSHLASTLADLRAHHKQPVDGLLQESHAVMGRYVLKHGDLLREALQGGKNNSENSIKWAMIKCFHDQTEWCIWE